MALLAFLAALACACEPAPPAPPNESGESGTEGDDELPGVVVLPPEGIAVEQGASGTLFARLTAEPADAVAVDVSSSREEALLVATKRLAFAPGNWSTPQAVTVTGVVDANAVSETVSVRFSGSGLNGAAVPVQVLDEDVITFKLSAAELGPVAEGSSASFSLSLAHEPAGPVTVTAVSVDLARLAVAPGVVVFSPSDWNVTKEVSVSALGDLDTADETLGVTLKATGLETRTVKVLVKDDDVQAVLASPATVPVREGEVASFGVRLAFKPQAAVVVHLAAEEPAVATVVPATLTFTPASYDSYQTATVAGASDPDAVSEATGVWASATGAVPRRVEVQVEDDDLLGVEPSAQNLTVWENGSAALGVALTAEPQGTVVVSLTSSDPGAATALPALLSFTPTDWSVAQNVVVGGANDPDALDETVTLSLSSPGLVPRFVKVVVSDDDVQDIVVSKGTVNLGEAGSTTFRVRLGAQPPYDLDVSVQSLDVGAAVASPPQLTFTPADWGQLQTVTVSGVADMDVANETVTIELSGSDLPIRVVTAQVADDDTQAVLVSAPQLTLGEGGIDSVGVRLAFAPAGPVLVSVQSVDPTAATVNPATLLFAPENYSTFQGVAVFGVVDLDAAVDVTQVLFTSPGALAAGVNVTVTDPGVLMVQSDVSSLALTEGQSAVVRVRLSAQPVGDLQVDLVASVPSAVVLSPPSLVFTSADWGAYQLVTVEAVHDLDNYGTDLTVDCTANGIPGATVQVAIADPDIPKLLLSEVVVAGSTGEFIEVTNPNPVSVDLSAYYLTNFGDYFHLPEGVTPPAGDFVVRFPQGTSLPPSSTLVVSVASAAAFQTDYGALPTYDIQPSGLVPPMEAVAGTPGSQALADSGEPVSLFYWNGLGDLVTDVDLVVAGSPDVANRLVDKSGLALDGPDADSVATPYRTEAMTLPLQAGAPQPGTSRVKAEAGYQTSGTGNGVAGDETSEDTSQTWQADTSPTPGTPSF